MQLQHDTLAVGHILIPQAQHRVAERHNIVQLLQRRVHVADAAQVLDAHVARVALVLATRSLHVEGVPCSDVGAHLRHAMQGRAQLQQRRTRRRRATRQRSQQRRRQVSRGRVLRQWWRSRPAAIAARAWVRRWRRVRLAGHGEQADSKQVGHQRGGFLLEIQLVGTKAVHGVLAREIHGTRHGTGSSRPRLGRAPCPVTAAPRRGTVWRAEQFQNRGHESPEDMV